MKNCLTIVGIAGCSLTLSLSSEPVRANTLGIDSNLESKFRITPFATGLNYPNGITQLSDGSLVVGTTQGGTAQAGSFFDPQAKGQLIRLQDTNGDGVADTKTVLYDGTTAGNNLPGGITAIRSADRYLFVTSSNEGKERISVFEQGTDFGANSLTLKGSFNFSFPVNRYQSSYSLALNQTGSQQFDLFFGVGSANPYTLPQNGNNIATLPNSVSLSGTDFGLATTSIEGNSVYKIPVTLGSTIGAAQPILVATGLRNPATLEFDKKTGSLYIGNNGIDVFPSSGINYSLTTDELNRLTAAQIQSSDVKNFGFPNYGEKMGSPGIFVDGNGQIVSNIPPGVTGALKSFQPISGLERTGLASIAFAPSAFPTGTNSGIFLGFAGRLATAPGPGVDLKNPLVYYDPTTGEYFDFLSTSRPGGDYGHFTSLLSTSDSLFAVDIAPGTAALFSPAGLGTGTIYQISAAQAVPEPSDVLGILLAGGAAFYLKRKLTPTSNSHNT